MDQDKPLFRDDAEGLFQEEGRDNWREEVFQIYWPASSSHDSEKCEELASLSEGFLETLKRRWKRTSKKPKVVSLGVV